jgi:hypothetical protein
MKNTSPMRVLGVNVSVENVQPRVAMASFW